MNFTDIHCHTLPGIDDGANDMEQALSMLKIANSEGIKTVVFTPHFHPAKGNQDVDTWKSVMEELKKQALDSGLEMDFYLGSELLYTHDLPDAIEDGRAISISDSDYVLVEFRFECDYNYLKSAVRDIQALGKRVILAHVERYDALCGDVDRIYELVQSGAYIQINSMSVTGKGGRYVKKFVKKLLKNELVHFIGTDAHSDGIRSPRMAECYEYICKKFSKEYADAIMCHNGIKVVNNEEV